MEDIYQIKIHYEKKEEQFDMMEEELIENSLSDFAKAQKKKIDDFAFYYKGIAINYKDSNKNHVKEIFGDERGEGIVFHVFAFLISGSPKKKIKEPEKVEEKKAPEMNKIEEEKKPEENKEKEEVKQFEREKKYFDIICPECKTSAIIDIDENNYTLNILNCENFHHLSDIKYSYYDNFIPFYDINLKDDSEKNLDKIRSILAPSRDLYECKKCSMHLAFLTPQPDKAMMNFCTCGDIICYECSENHNEQGHIKVPIEMKNYHCFIHNKSFESYCLDCNCNICSECEKDKDKTHEKHTILKYGDFKPKQGEIKEFEDKIKDQKETFLPNFIKHIKEEFNKIINEVESYIKSYIAIEETLIRRYNKDKTLNFQLLRNLSNPKIFDNSLFNDLKKFSNENEGSTKKFAFLTKIYENIIKNKKEKLLYTPSKIQENKITLTYSTKNTNNMNKYVKLFDPIFVKNNKDKFSITINGKNEKELKEYYYNRSNEPKLDVILKEKGDKPVTNMSYMLNNCKNLTNADFKDWKFSNINSMEAMFQLTNIKNIPKDIESKHLKNVRAMFCKCLNVENIPDLRKIFCKDNKIEDISMLFNGCKNLIKVDKLSEWLAPKLKKMEYLFDRCEKIADIYLGTFNTEHVKSMCGLFNGCSSLTVIKAKKIWETSNLEDISIMFQGCSSLEKGDFISYLSNTSKVKDMSGLFSKCSNVKKINIPKLVTNNVEYMVGLFNECTALEKIEASTLNMSNIKDISGMFYKCTGLKTLNGIDNWHFNREFKYENTFDQCPNIKTDEFNNKLKAKIDQIKNNNNNKIEN